MVFNVHAFCLQATEKRVGYRCLSPCAERIGKIEDKVVAPLRLSQNPRRPFST